MKKQMIPLEDMCVKLSDRTVNFLRNSIITIDDEDDNYYYVSAPYEDKDDFTLIQVSKAKEYVGTKYVVEEYRAV